MKTTKKLITVILLGALAVSLPACTLTPGYTYSGSSYVTASPAVERTRVTYVRPVVTVSQSRPKVVVTHPTVIVRPRPIAVVRPRLIIAIRPYPPARTIVVTKPCRPKPKIRRYKPAPAARPAVCYPPPKIRPFRKISPKPPIFSARRQDDYSILTPAMSGNRGKSPQKGIPPGLIKKRQTTRNNGLQKGYSKQKNRRNQPANTVKFRGNQPGSKAGNSADRPKNPQVTHRGPKVVSHAAKRDKVDKSRSFKQPKNRGDYPGSSSGKYPKTGKSNRGKTGKSSMLDRAGGKSGKAPNRVKSRKFRESNRGKGGGKRR